MANPITGCAAFRAATLVLVFLIGVAAALPAQARRTTSTAATSTMSSQTTPPPVLRLSTFSRDGRAGRTVASPRTLPPLTPQEKLNLALVASLVVKEVETPIRLTASSTRVLNRASLKLFEAMLVTSPDPADEGMIELPLKTAMQIDLWFPHAGQPHLLDCLGAAREPGISLTLVMQVGGESNDKTQLIIPPGWHHITSLLIPEKAGGYMVKLWPHNTLDLKYCEITPFK